MSIVVGGIESCVILKFLGTELILGGFFLVYCRLAVDQDSQRAAAPRIYPMLVFLQPPGQSAKSEALLLQHGVLHLLQFKWCCPRCRNSEGDFHTLKLSSYRRWTDKPLVLSEDPICCKIKYFLDLLIIF
jgi:hypothetical protein